MEQLAIKAPIMSRKAKTGMVAIPIRDAADSQPKWIKGTAADVEMPLSSYDVADMERLNNRQLRGLVLRCLGRIKALEKSNNVAAMPNVES
jgi:hypothetical protein